LFCCFDVDKPCHQSHYLLHAKSNSVNAHFWHTSSCQFFMFSNDLAIYFDCQVVLIQEQLSKNRIIIDTDSKGRYYVYYIEFILVSSRFWYCDGLPTVGMALVLSIARLCGCSLEPTILH
jgi:hypothetical protein